MNDGAICLYQFSLAYIQYNTLKNKVIIAISQNHQNII